MNLISTEVSVLAGLSEDLIIQGVSVLIGGHNLPPLVEIGFTDLPYYLGVPWHPTCVTFANIENGT